jgi:hypothetical protein
MQIDFSNISIDSGSGISMSFYGVTRLTICDYWRLKL